MNNAPVQLRSTAVNTRLGSFKSPTRKQRQLSLALQGGGTHGALTWGVLDRLLDEDQLTLEGIAATSAGSINAVLLAYGLSTGGRQGAKQTLARFWREISDSSASNIFRPSLFDPIMRSFGYDYSAGFLLTSMFWQFLSPYQFNPLNLNPLKTLLANIIDFQIVREQTAVKLFLCATDVRSCKIKVFRTDEITPQHVLASSCLPMLMQAVEIDGHFYWDGGFIGNPAIFPLIYECDARDVMLVHLTPTHRFEIPTTPSSILTRMQEISLNAGLVREMRAVAFVNRLVDHGKTTEGKHIFIHSIEAEDEISKLPITSKLNGDWDFLCHLFNLGRKRANEWLSDNIDRLGTEFTTDLEARYM